jgi:hypothetical protein
MRQSGWFSGRYLSGQKARKSWVCDQCGAGIPPGSWYVFAADRGPGTNVLRYCETCAAVIPNAPTPPQTAHKIHPEEDHRATPFGRNTV